MRQADLNFEKLKTESERLEQHTKKSVNWLLWLMLILVSFTFISMILFIRIFPRLRWWQWSPVDLEVIAPRPPAFGGPVLHRTCSYAHHVTGSSGHKTVGRKKKRKRCHLSRNICTFESQCLQCGEKLPDIPFSRQQISLFERARRQQKSQF